MRKDPIARKLEDVAPVACPCGESRRIITAADDALVGFHVTRIEGAQAHYHRNATEIYYILDGQGSLILSGAEYDISPGSVAYIPPGCVHQGTGSFTAAIAVLPPFDPQDEFIAGDEQPSSSQQPTVRHRDDVEARRTACGSSQRILTRDDDVAAGLHLVRINAAECHYHRRTTEIYHILEGEGWLDVGENSYPLGPGLTVYVPAGLPHEGRGDFTCIVICAPPFDPDDQIVV